MAFASCTRFSPNTRWPAAITGSIASAPKVFDTATSVTSAGSRAGLAAGARDLGADVGEAGSGGHACHGPPPYQLVTACESAANGQRSLK